MSKIHRVRFRVKGQDYSPREQHLSALSIVGSWIFQQYWDDLYCSVKQALPTKVLCYVIALSVRWLETVSDMVPTNCQQNLNLILFVCDSQTRTVAASQTTRCGAPGDQSVDI